MNREHLTCLMNNGVLSHLDAHFAAFVEGLAGGGEPELLLAAALVSASSRRGHICLDLAATAGQPVAGDDGGAEACRCPDLARWHARLTESPLVGRPGDYRPLILDDRSRLYLLRYWLYQERLADSIRRRTGGGPQALDLERLREGLNRLFPSDGTAAPDWQKIAAFAAVRAGFAAISGGPGTGKTTTVAKILALLVEQAGGSPLRIALAAPTGKAAARLQEAIKHAKGALNCQPEVKAAIPEQASTIHRLLGAVPGSPYFRHDEKNRLPVDAVVVDEASMVDLALMSKLVQALPLTARLVLLGDKDQLASVEAGAVLGDICDTGRPHGYSRAFLEELHRATGYRLETAAGRQDEAGIADCIVQLQKSYRFGTDSGIGVLSRAVNDGDGDLALSILKSGPYDTVRWHRLPSPQTLAAAVRSAVDEGFRGYLECPDQQQVFKLFDRFRVLCAVREGPFGVASLNTLVEKILAERKLIAPGKKWYAGRPVLIKTNDYNLRLFNGDVGIALPDREAGGGLRVFFPAPDGTARKFHPLRLPDHETVFAMTVHKSQGSEFDRVLLILPERDAPVLTRELVYTAISRAREQVEVWGTEGIFQAAVTRRIERMSGLRDALWNG